jgi:hypothetical protein
MSKFRSATQYPSSTALPSQIGRRTVGVSSIGVLVIAFATIAIAVTCCIIDSARDRSSRRATSLTVCPHTGHTIPIPFVGFSIVDICNIAAAWFTPILPAIGRGIAQKPVDCGAFDTVEESHLSESSQRNKPKPGCVQVEDCRITYAISV